jgi:hypothetical protein
MPIAGRPDKDADLLAWFGGDMVPDGDNSVIPQLV